MKVHGLTVCVDYADHLTASIRRWSTSLATLTVVTSLRDQDTVALCAGFNNVHVFRTDVFYLDGASFNKGRAMELARESMPWEDWILIFDADIIPEEAWLLKTEAMNPTPGQLYSAWRHQCADPARPEAPEWPRITGDVIGVGYFQLFHASDPAVNKDRPLIETHWIHAGNYDNNFMRRWPRAKRIELPIHLAHLGSRDNWFGRGRLREFEEMQAERRRRGGSWQHERISNKDC